MREASYAGPATADATARAAIGRRRLMAASGATLAALRNRGVRSAEADVPPARVSAPWPLWPGRPPGGGGPSGTLRIDRRGAASHVAVPTLTRVIPAAPNGRSVLVAAGGGYQRIGIAAEAMPAARWLAARGITAFVLLYRLPGEGWENGALAPLQDAQRAVRLIRAWSPRLGLDPSRVGALGFSAGGHLLGLAAAWSAERSYAAMDDVDRASPRPDDAALIYPVITLEPPFDGTNTRRMTVGDHPGLAREAAWSVQTHVGPRCPPIFLVQAEDDPIAPAENALLMAEACDSAGVPVSLHLLSRGGHGFGMGRPGTPSARWPVWYDAWLRTEGWV